MAHDSILSLMHVLGAWMFEAEPGLYGYLIYMIVRTVLNICGSHRFRPLLHPFDVSYRESSSVKEGYFTKDSEHVHGSGLKVREYFTKDSEHLYEEI